jgi:hypothetical protein
VENRDLVYNLLIDEYEYEYEIDEYEYEYERSYLIGRLVQCVELNIYLREIRKM